MSKEENVFFNSVELLNKRIAASEEAAKKLQEATREANATLKAVGQAKRELEAQKEVLVAAVDARVGALIIETTYKALEDMGKMTEEQIALSVKKVASEFDRLENILLGTKTENTGKSIREYIKELELAFGVSYTNLIRLLKLAQEGGKDMT